MCLSTAYVIKNGLEEKVCENINSIDIKPGKVLLTDFLGNQTEIAGVLHSSDMTTNTIRIVGVPDKDSNTMAEVVKHNANHDSPLCQTLGISITEVDSKGATGQMVLSETILNGRGIVHGGALVALADTVGGVAAVAACGYPCVTISNSFQYLSSKGATGILYSKADVIHLGQNTVSCSVYVYDETEKKIATASFTYFIRPYYYGTT